MPADSPSRLGLNIGEYDQVIALSQAHINQTLEYHYDTHEDLQQIKAVLGTAMNEAIRGKIKAPRIELIDSEGADQAFYCLEFTSGNYSWWESEAKDSKAPVDPDAPPSAMIQKQIPLKDWKLAFYVDLVMKKMEKTIPDNIRKQINLPEVYSVEQLLIDFGTADQ
jgi:hypothetical protein